LGLALVVWAHASAAQQRFETPEATNEKIRQLALSAQSRLGDYVIGSGDLLQIDVFDVPELSREMRVSESGYISIPLLPVKVRAGGLTAFQLEEKVAELLQANGLVSKPQVTVRIKEQRSQPITVIGSVQRPMVYQAIRQTTLLEVLSEAGGIADDAGSVVIVTRPAKSGEASETAAAESAGTAPPQETISIHLRDLLESGNPEFNIPVFGGDIISVPRSGIVYVVGAVEKPGGFVLQSDGEEMTVLKAVALAQGFKGSAKPHQAVILRKSAVQGTQQEIAVDLNKVMARKAEDVRLHANDILFVPDSAGKRALKRIGDAALSITSGLVILRGGR
jgi:polysaccharide export outer membrane protein